MLVPCVRLDFLISEFVVCYVEKKMLAEFLGDVDEAIQNVPRKYLENRLVPCSIPSQGDVSFFRFFFFIAVLFIPCWYVSPSCLITLSIHTVGELELIQESPHHEPIRNNKSGEATAKMKKPQTSATVLW